MKTLEVLFEAFLWRSRLVVLFAVMGSLLTGLGIFYVTTVDVWYMLVHIGEYASPALDAEGRAQLRSGFVTHVVEAVDGYLLATVMLIFSLGLYELFISKIDEAEGAETSSRVMVIHSLDDLKARLIKVIFMILVVKFFEHAVRMDYTDTLQLLILAGAIALIGPALFLSHAGESSAARPTARHMEKD